MSALPSRAHGWRVALRLASRTARRTIGRTILVGALIALPVAGVAAFATLYASMQGTIAEKVSVELGHAKSALQIVAPANSGLRQSPTNFDMWDQTSYEESSDWTSDVTPLLPTATRLLSVESTTVTATTATGIGSMDASIGDSWDPALEGRFLMGDGRRPTSDSEAMVSESALQRLGIAIGGTLELTMPHPATYTVVGTLRSAEVASSRDQVFLPGSYSTELPTPDTIYNFTYYLPDIALTWPQILELNTHGVVALSLPVALNPPGGDFPANDQTGGTVVTGMLILGFALIEVGLLAAAAFMVGARQQQRTLAVLASVGADRKTVARVVSLNGLVIGITGALVGIGIGIGIGAVLMMVTADGSRTQYPGFHLQPIWLGGIALLAVIAAWIAALVPARASSKLDIVAALRGSARPPKPGKRTPLIAILVFVLGILLGVAGLVLVGVAATQLENISGQLGTVAYNPAAQAEYQQYRNLSTVGIALLAIGPVVAQVAAIIIAPAIFRVVARALSAIGVGTRLASRDAARNAARTVPAASVVMSTVFLSAFIICLLAGTQQAANDNYQPQYAENQVGMSLIHYSSDLGQEVYDNPDAFVTALQASFDTDQVRVLSSSKGVDDLIPMPRLAPQYQCEPGADRSDPCWHHPQFMNSYSTDPIDQKIWIGDAADLALMLGEKVSDQSSATLRDGGIVAFYPQVVDGGTATIDWWPNDGDLGYSGQKPEREDTLPATYQKTDKPGSFAFFMLPETADSIGLEYVPSLVLASTTTPATQAQEDAGRAAAEALTTGYSNVVVERGPQQFAQWQWLVLAISAVIMLAAASVAIGLARSDGRRDDAVLGAIGASPRLRRSFGFWQAIVICGTGAVIGVLLGFSEYAALAGATLVDPGVGIPFVVPLLPLAATVIGVPLVIAIGSWLTARPGRTHVMDRSAIA